MYVYYVCMYVCMYVCKIVNPALVQMNRENDFFPVPVRA